MELPAFKHPGKLTLSINLPSSALSLYPASLHKANANMMLCSNQNRVKGKPSRLWDSQTGLVALYEQIRNDGEMTIELLRVRLGEKFYQNPFGSRTLFMDSRE